MFKRPLFILLVIMAMSSAVFAFESNNLLSNPITSSPLAQNVIRLIDNISSISITPNVKLLLNTDRLGCEFKLSPLTAVKINKGNNYTSLTVTIDLN